MSYPRTGGRFRELAARLRDRPWTLALIGITLVAGMGAGAIASRVTQGETPAEATDPDDRPPADDLVEWLQARGFIVTPIPGSKTLSVLDPDGELTFDVDAYRDGRLLIRDGRLRLVRPPWLPDLTEGESAQVTGNVETGGLRRGAYVFYTGDSRETGLERAERKLMEYGFEIVEPAAGGRVVAMYDWLDGDRQRIEVTAVEHDSRIRMEVSSGGGTRD